MYDFGLLLKQLRKNKGLTQQQLAEKINRNKTVISKYENNLLAPTLETLIQFSVIFNVSLDYLAGLHVNKSASLDGLNENQEQIILALVQEFKSEINLNIKGLSGHQLELINETIKELI
ncbi:MAG: helix-turn-helix domain-containing protein [Oscillospiraceae bacterium]|nr:helix-turn-helix domain-containing protein [Oscillospiraceae bacterium]